MARTLLSAPPTDRKGRYPKHTFQVQAPPFTVQPIALARVLPGETLSNLYFESRVVTDPILNPIIGWKKEYYFFYVKITDLLLDAAKDMFVDPTNAEIAGQDIGASTQHTYAAKGAIDWTSKAVDRIVETYFRDEGEAASTYALADGRRMVQVRESTWLDSLTLSANMPEGEAVASATDMGDLDRLMDAYEMLRAMNIADMTYEDWLRSQGIAIPGKDQNRPELLSRFTQWSYPTNTIDPTDGSPASAVSWVFKNDDRAPKRFKEPGFVVGLSITRPKVYFAGLYGSLAGFAQRAWDWVPNYMAHMPETALKEFSADAGPLGDRLTATAAYWADMRDDLIHGDQFQNVVAAGDNADPPTTGENHLLALPHVSNLEAWKYPTEAQVLSLFVTATLAGGRIREDGVLSLSIKGLQQDYTVGNLARG